jgi:hypothetical protein
MQATRAKKFNHYDTTPRFASVLSSSLSRRDIRLKFMTWWFCNEFVSLYAHSFGSETEAAFVEWD